MLTIILFTASAAMVVPLSLVLGGSPRNDKKQSNPVTGNVAVFSLVLACVFFSLIKLIIATGINMDAGPAIQSSSPNSQISLINQSAKTEDIFNHSVSQENYRPYRWQALPDEPPFPSDNPPTPAKISLGKTLFNDPALSKDGTVSCATCHDLKEQAGTDGRNVAIGIGNQSGIRNTPTIWNSGFQKNLFWDGRANSLEQQALQPLLNPIEMGLTSEQHIIDQVSQNHRYKEAFRQSFGDENITVHRITQAIASYERTLVTNDSAYDDFVRGDIKALTPEQINGMALFEKVGCVLCHSGPNFSVASIYSSTSSLRLFPANPSSLITKYTLTDNADGTPSAWRVPSLRNVALTGPWFHNGSIDDLEEVVQLMATVQLNKKGGRKVLWSDNQFSVIDNPTLTEQETKDIVAFLHALTSRKLLVAKKESALDKINQEPLVHASYPSPYQ